MTHSDKLILATMICVSPHLPLWLGAVLGGICMGCAVWHDWRRPE